MDSQVREYLGNVVLIYLFAYLFFLVCECPVANLDKLILSKVRSPERQHQEKSKDETSPEARHKSNGNQC